MNTFVLRSLMIAGIGLMVMAAGPVAAETETAPALSQPAATAMATAAPAQPTAEAATAAERLAIIPDTLDPDPERFRQEIDAFVDMDAKNSSPSGSILFIGSSSARMWKTARAFPDMPVVNRGFGGSHATDILHHYAQVVAPHDPSVVVLYIGDNDVAGGKSADRVLGDIDRLVSRIRADDDDVRIVFLSIKPSGLRWEMWPEMSRVNDAMLARSESDPWLHYADVATPLLGLEGLPDDRLFLSDRLHLNDAGYEAWTKALRPVLIQARSGL